MAISPNDDFTAGQVLTATECNNFPRGVMARAVNNTTSYTLTTTETIATSMTVTFTAVADRYYRITYFEPQAQTATVLSNTTATIRQTNAAGTVLNSTVFQNESAVQDQSGMICVSTNTFTAGSITVVGCAKSSSVTGAPTLVRDATRVALLLVEDIGPA
jgi:hypothetical protein